MNPSGPPSPALAPAIRRLVQRVRDACAREDLFPTRAPALVLVSGGPDSLALLHLLASGLLGEAGPGAVRAMHVDHHLRGDESLADEVLVRSVCERWGLPLVVRDGDLRPGAGNLQARARELRRALAREEATSAEVVALGHTRDDQVETLLYRLGRYGGLASLRGMAPREGGLVRPLLALGREETAAYCRWLGEETARDRGNLDPHYVRTRLRHEVLPLLDSVIPGFRDPAARTAEVALELLAVARRAAADADRDLLPGGGESTSLADARWSAARLLALDGSLRRFLLWELLDALPLVVPSRGLVLEIERALERGGSSSVALGGGRCLQARYGWVTVSEEPTAGGADRLEGDEETVLPVPGAAHWRGLEVQARLTERFQAPDPAREAYLDAREVPTRLTVRAARPGDRLRPLRAPGTRSVQDLLVDRRVPAPLRPGIPMVADGERLLWVGGVAVAHQSRIRRDSGGLVHLRIERANGREKA